MPFQPDFPRHAGPVFRRLRSASLWSAPASRGEPARPVDAPGGHDRCCQRALQSRRGSSPVEGDGPRAHPVATGRTQSATALRQRRGRAAPRANDGGICARLVHRHPARQLPCTFHRGGIAHGGRRDPARRDTGRAAGAVCRPLLGPARRPDHQRPLRHGADVHADPGDLMRARFLAILRLGGGALPAGRIEQAGTAAGKLDLLVHTDRLLLWSNGGMVAPGHVGQAIVGELFERGSMRPQRSIADAGWAAIGRSRGQILVERYWGAYVAFAAEQHRVAVVRAPLGDVGCFYARTPDALMMASDIALLRDAIGRSPSVDAQALVRHIAWPEWRRDETCLESVRELRGGDRLLVSPDGVACETLWSPWAFVARDWLIDDPDEAARAIGQAVRVSVSARAASSNRLLLLLSGGLDSAIVAASLARVQADFSCLNLVGDDAASDEQSYAGLVARSVGAELHVQSFDLKRVDVGRSGAAHMPYPVHRCFTQAQDSLAAEVAERQGADMILDGGGGDNVFFASRSVSILADCLIVGGFDRRFLSATRTLGDLGQAGCLSLEGKADHR